MTDALIEFLRARLDEDEQAARATAWSPNTMTHNPWEARRPRDDDEGWTVWSQGRFLMFSNLEEADAVHIGRHDPAQTLADLRAKRQVLADADRFVAEFEAGPDPYGSVARRAWRWRDTLHRNMAGAYRDHPDYRSEWVPEEG